MFVRNSMNLLFSKCFARFFTWWIQCTSSISGKKLFHESDHYYTFSWMKYCKNYESFPLKIVLSCTQIFLKLLSRCNEPYMKPLLIRTSLLTNSGLNRNSTGRNAFKQRNPLIPCFLLYYQSLHLLRMESFHCFLSQSSIVFILNALIHPRCNLKNDWNFLSNAQELTRVHPRI